MQTKNNTIKKYRINVTGSAQILSKENAIFCEELGAELIKVKNIVIVTGGLKHFKEFPDVPSADWSFIQGALSHIKSSNTNPIEQIETFLPDTGKDLANVVRFHEGKVIVLEGHSLQARRFSMVKSVDVIVTIEGKKGTKGIIDSALANEKPFLPLPFTCGSSEKRWKEHRERIKKWFNISDEIGDYIESVNLKTMSKNSIGDCAKLIKKTLLQYIHKKVFISYTKDDFKDALNIYELLKNNGYNPWIDKKKLIPGQDWETEIEKVIEECDYFIACLSKRSVSKQGFFKAELNKGLEIFDSKMDGSIYLIPVRFDDCPIPMRFKRIQCCDIFEESGKEKLLKAVSTS
jgi:hypothetical protein